MEEEKLSVKAENGEQKADATQMKNRSLEQEAEGPKKDAEVEKNTKKATSLEVKITESPLKQNKKNKSVFQKKTFDKEMGYQQKLEKLQTGRSRAILLASAAAAIAVIAIIVCIYSYRSWYNSKITMIIPIGEITFVDKYQEDERYYITFQAADYNRVPTQLNGKGICVQVEKEVYDILALDIKYNSANVVFEVPKGVARKVGYEEEKLNVQNLWTEDVLMNYTTLKSIVWSTNY